MVSGEIFRTNLNMFVQTYLENDIRKSIITNGHMNEYCGEYFNQDDAMRQYLFDVVNQFCVDYNGATKIGDLVYGLLDAARKYYFNNARPHKDNTIKAVLVDFINYVAAARGMDLALYTLDF